MVRASDGRSAKLYTPRLLSLSAQLAEFPLTDTFLSYVEVRSRTCGSVIELGLDLDTDGDVRRIGMQVSACAVGQSSAAVLALAAKGRAPSEFEAAQAAIERWLKGEGPAPNWPGFDALEPALGHAGRHGALLLPWNGVVQALSSAASTR